MTRPDNTPSWLSFTALEATGEWSMVVYPTGEVLPVPAAPPAPPSPPPRVPVPPRTPSDVSAPLHRAPVPTPIATVRFERAVKEPAAEIAPEEHTVRAVELQPAVDETVLRPRRRTVVIAVDGCKEEELAVPVLVGRRPRPRRDHTLLRIASPGQEVSRVHAVIDVDDRNAMVVIDQDSVNGTYINGVQAEANAITPVPEGAVLQLGDVQLRVRR